MKYRSKVDMSEAEFIALLTLADTMMQRLMARRFNVVKHPRGAAPIVEEDYGDDEDVSAVFNREPAPASDADADDAAEMMTAHDAEIAAHEARIEDGTRAWAPVVRLWAQNYGVEDAPQPDRAGALMAVFNGHGRAASAYIRERGGLAGACIDTLAREGIVAPGDAVTLGKRIALNMMQVGTAIGLPIDHLIERSLLNREEPDDAMPRGGLLGDLVDMTRPVYGNNEKA